MAKQLVNPVERHVEKLVLAIVAVVLIFVVVKYVFTSPNVIEMGGERVASNAIDTRLAQKANEIIERIRSARPQEIAHEALYDAFAANLAPLKGELLPPAVAMGSAVPLVDPPEGVAGLAALVKPPQPEKPAFTLGRNTVLVTNEQGTDLRQPTDWVTVSVVLDVKALSDLQRKTWGATQAEVVFAPPELQKRMRREDETWSDSDWTMVQCSPALTLPNPPRIRFVEDGGKFTAVKDDQRAFEKYAFDLAEPAVQLAALRPYPPVVVRDDHPWRFPEITSYDDVLKQDDEYLHPKDPPRPNPEDRYGLKVTGPVQPVTVAQTADEQLAQRLAEAQALYDSAVKSRSVNDATTAYNEALTISADRQASAATKDRASKLMNDANRLRGDILRQRAFGGNATNRPPDGQPTTETVTREKLPRQQTWAHDWAPGSIIDGATYQYRMRVRILNRLAAFPESFENPEDAKVVFIESEWSEPTAPITIPRSSMFFVTRDDSRRREISVEFYRWYDGVWIKSPAVKFNEGDKLANETRTPVPGLQDRHQAENALVTFSADLTLLDIDFARPHRERKGGSSASGVRFGSVSDSTSAVFVDSKGRLVERVVALDKADPTRRSVDVWSPRK